MFLVEIRLKKLLTFKYKCFISLQKFARVTKLVIFLFKNHKTCCALFGMVEFSYTFSMSLIDCNSWDSLS